LLYNLQVGALKIYAATVEALKKKERQGETQFTTRTAVPPPVNSNVFLFFGEVVFLGNLTLFMIEVRFLVLFSLLYR
jgi:hypothetical protein